MACIKVTFVFLLFGITVQAQTFAEWFKQKSTQKKYLYQQIAALQIYSGYLQKGYHIAQGGLGSIGSYIGNEYVLHSGYYTHLQTVSVPVKNDPQVNDILRWQKDILIQTDQVKHQAGLSSKETTYIGKVCNALLNDCDGRLNDLQTIMADQKTKMSDEERLRQIARLHQAMQENNRFAAVFAKQVKVYVLQKQKEKMEVITLKNLYENR